MTRDQLMLVQEMMKKRVEAATNIPASDIVAYWELTAAIAALVAVAWRNVALLPKKQVLKITPAATTGQLPDSEEEAAPGSGGPPSEPEPEAGPVEAPAKEASPSAPSFFGGDPLFRGF